MRIVEGFTLRTVMNEPVIVAEGVKQVNFNKLISLNASAALLWKSVEGMEFSNDDLATILVEHYGIDHETAFFDASEISAAWIKHGLVER